MLIGIASELAIVALMWRLARRGEFWMVAFFGYTFVGNAVLMAVDKSFPPHHNPYYLNVWIGHNVGWHVGAFLMVRHALKRLDAYLPLGAWWIACMAAVVVGGLLQRPNAWAGSMLQHWEWWFGIVSLWLGLVSILACGIDAVCVKTNIWGWHARVLAALVLLDAICLFPASVTQHIGVAGNLATTCCSAAWIWIFWRRDVVSSTV